jgi:hypothetical protein
MADDADVIVAEAARPSAPDTSMPNVRNSPWIRGALHNSEAGGENYFPQSAFEHVLGKPLGAYFPLDPARNVTRQIPSYGKEMNGKLAEANDLETWNGTDRFYFLMALPMFSIASPTLRRPRPIAS